MISPWPVARALCATLVASLAGAASAHVAAFAPLPTEAFAPKPVMEQVQLSPDGERLAAFVIRGDETNVETGRRSLVHGAQTSVQTWLTDASHGVRVGVRRTDADIEIIACNPDGSNWHKLWRYQLFDANFVWPLGCGRDPNRL